MPLQQLQRMTLLSFPNGTSDARIGVVMNINSSTKTRPSRHLCPILAKYDSLQNQELLTCFETLVPFVRESPQRLSAVIFDGAAVVQKLKPIGVVTFEQCAIDIFKPYIMSQLNVAGRVDIQGGQFEVINPKETWKRHPRLASPSTAVPKNWHNFLRVDDNKQELFHYLSLSCASWTIGVVATADTQVLVSPARDSSSLASCLHEEADTRMFVHAADAASRVHKKIIIHTVDSDVGVLALYVVQQLGVDELWQDFGVGRNRKYIASHLLPQAIGNRKSKCLSFFHGCGSTPSVLGHGKRSAWEAWVSFLQHRSALNNYALLRKSHL